jgi:hypothetical protein
MCTILFRDARLLGWHQAIFLFWRPIVPESMDFSQRMQCELHAFGVGRCGDTADAARLLLWDRAKHSNRFTLIARLIQEIQKAMRISCDYAAGLGLEWDLS